jgi:ribosomal protein S18 acetylase RimI-like enzyme
MGSEQGNHHVIRLLGPGDDASVQSLLHELLATKPVGFYWTWPGLQDELRKSVAHGLFVENTLVAFVLYRAIDSVNEIMTLATNPHHQGRGSMKKLLRILIDASGEATEWWLEVHANNLKALQLYQSLGFLLMNRRKGYYPDGGDALMMSLKRS